MPDIDGWADVLPAEQRALWPVAAETAAAVDGVLMGGTAVAVHLRHRVSEDLDVMTLRHFSGRGVERLLRRLSSDVQTVDSGECSFHGYVDGVKFDVFRALPIEGVAPREMRVVADGIEIDGLRVGSLPDLMATKLAVIMYRPKLRDYIDIAAMDRSRRCPIEQGLVYYCRRFGHSYPPRHLERVVRLLASPGRLPADPMFDSQGPDALSHLRARAAEAMCTLSAMRSSALPSGRGPAPARRADMTRRASTGAVACGIWMPRAKARCVLASGHKGPHRSRR